MARGARARPQTDVRYRDACVGLDRPPPSPLEVLPSKRCRGLVRVARRCAPPRSLAAQTLCACTRPPPNSVPLTPAAALLIRKRFDEFLSADPARRDGATAPSRLGGRADACDAGSAPREVPGTSFVPYAGCASRSTVQDRAQAQQIDAPTSDHAVHAGDAQHQHLERDAVARHSDSTSHRVLVLRRLA